MTTSSPTRAGLPTGRVANKCDDRSGFCGNPYGTTMRRADRRYTELLQQLRVAQTGVQVLLACLLALAFTPRFAHLTGFQRGVYVVSLLSGAASAAMLIAPLPCHRILFQRRLKRQLVTVTARFMGYGLLLLLLSLGAAVPLVVGVVAGGRFAAWLSAATIGWFATWWYVVPVCIVVGRDRRPDCGR